MYSLGALMKKLIILHDAEKAKDENSYMYVKQMCKEIENFELINISKIGEYVLLDKLREANREKHKIIVVYPYSAHKNMIDNYLKSHPELDLELAVNGGMTPTAEAIIEKLPKTQDLRDKTILIINNSIRVGKPLNNSLLARGLNTICVGREADYFKIVGLIYFYEPHILITATGDDNFKIPPKVCEIPKMIIDLSEDCKTENKITHINTIQKIKERLK